MISFLPDAGTLRAEADAQADLHGRAGATARESFGDKVFVRGVVEVSNYCRENCDYCGMRRDNRELERFRATVDELAELLIHHRPASVTDINFQAGEDPVAARKIVLPLVRTLKENTDLGISVCLGTLDEPLYEKLREAGAGMYIIKFETGDRDLYGKLKSPGTPDEREAHIRMLARAGWFVSSGFIAGLPGQTMESLLGDFRHARDLPLDGCSVSPFVPGEATPLSASPAADVELVLNCMAALRLMKPSWVIPAVSALNLGGARDGYVRGLRAGANLCTINLTPGAMRGDYLLYKRDRHIMTEERILTAIEAAGLKPSPKSLATLYPVEA